MKKVNILIALFVIILSFMGCSQTTNLNSNNNELTVAVSIVPEETFVKAVAGDLVNVVTMVPPGYSPANYAPTPKEIQSFCDASVYFAIGVPTEEANLLPKAKDINKKLKIIKLNEKVKNVYPEIEFGEGKRDPHIWLSPKRVKVIINVIADTLSEIDSENESTYRKKAKEYIKQLDELDKEIKASLENLENKIIIVYHPAFGYFAKDYGLEMICIEEEGKEPAPKDFEKLIDRAKKENIKVIFYQAEIDSRQSKTFADEIGGKAKKISPLAPNYIENLRETAKTFKSVLEKK